VRLLIALGLAYLAGSFPTAYLLGRARGVDVGAAGSGNYGTTNVFRTLGPASAIVALVVDVAKGLLAVELLPRWIPVPELTLLTYGVLIGIAAILGHVFSVWLGFRGGKGIATAFGVFLALAPWVTFAAMIVWVAVVLIGRVVSLASLAAAVVLLLGVIAVHRGALERDWPIIAATAVLVALVFWTHRSNIKRLRRGQEKPIAAMRRVR
jgi:glycerol-3-phosphate acyltransferase PlsY